MLASLARSCVRARWLVTAAWITTVVVLSVLAGAFAGPTSDDFSLPGSESQRAADLLADAGFTARSGTQAQVVLHAEDGVDTAATRDAVEDLATGIPRELPGAEVTSPFDPGGERQIAPGGDIAYLQVDLPLKDQVEVADAVDRLEELRDDVDVPGLQVEIGLPSAEESSGPPAEVFGVLAAAVILLIAFGSFVAMLLPLLVGVLGALGGVAAIELAAHGIDVPSYAAAAAGMIAIGVGVDYALLVVTRFREALRDGLPVPEAVALAQHTAGRSVLFAGITVVIASLGLVLMGMELITGMAIGIAASVLVTMLGAVTLLPALLGIVGPRLQRAQGRPRRFGRRDRSGAAAERWSRSVQRRPLVFAVAALGTLLVLAIPVLDLRLGFSDAGTLSEESSARKAYDLVAEGFGPGVNGPFVVAVDAPSGTAGPAAEELAQAFAADPGVASVSPAMLSEDGGTAVLQVVPTSAPRDEATADLVHRLRDDAVPPVVDGTGAEVAIGGAQPAAIDFADYTAERLPLFLAVVLGLSFLLLTVVFRGLLVALKAVVVNLLSIGAAFGALVAVFQWGWLTDLLGIEGVGPIEAWVPMLLIAIVFGLSMDYEVFLLSRIREEYDRTGDNATSVATGLARTARVITAAAAIMVCVFGSFVLGSDRDLQLFGFGLAVAVLIDATLVRMVLVPATMELLGRANWWLPAWLDRRLPHLTVEGSVSLPREPERVPAGAR
ncbi:MMPL family transporter [Blastococcus haudaquaticus]|uniref:Putative drug exporter of the RND superfamily n=1 Tax=Blastococcus haudaquaticus TaxID=1938745 RepID=A0A286H161_9ACTN|nr:MMPL family transporter [Blastococcus haudaquaticus]SOE01481.1 putative drug exporter of the RND superfamily [Blastococcus haudaquaticus]